MPRFKLQAPFSLSGDQAKAVRELVEGIRAGKRFQTLLGVTGSGKTFTMAKVIEEVGLPTLVLSHNKTLAAQLYLEFKAFFPDNAVEYFVSYYDYYQPEAYIPATDTYIEKETSINLQIEKLRLSATRSLFERSDVIVVASVSCIYGLGSPEAYYGMTQEIKVGQRIDTAELARNLAKMQYQRTSLDLAPGYFRFRGDLLEVYPPYEDEPVRISFWGDEVEEIAMVDHVTGHTISKLSSVVLYPKTHYVTPEDRLMRAIAGIEEELEQRLAELRAEGKVLEAARLEQRTRFDLEMLRNIGYCQGIENYSRHLSGRRPGEPPPTLLDYFPPKFLCFIDESHVTVPQVRGMYHGDRSRKETLVEYGFRLPSALDNRPLTFEEFEERLYQVVFVSATPGAYEREMSGGEVVEQLIRPTGLLDPEVVIRPARGQVDDLIEEVRRTVSMGDRVLVTTLTKRMAEELTAYLQELGIRARYLHSEIDALERWEILSDLRRGEFDVLVGINLLREGLDLPEVSLVAILDADQEGFLRSETSLIQTIGRAARNVRGRAILYADRMTGSLKRAVEETKRRRSIQAEYNRKHGITPRSISKRLADPADLLSQLDYYGPDEEEEDWVQACSDIALLKRRMAEAARKLKFEEAAKIRDRIRELERSRKR